MSKEDLQKSLEALQAELDKLDGPEEEIRDRATRLIDDIERQLENPEANQDEDTLVERIQKTLEQFEVEHPRITGIMNRIMMTLSDMGI